MSPVLTYEGFTLFGRVSGGYYSVFGNESVRFDTVAQWVQYVNIKIGKNEEQSKKRNRN